MAFEAEESRKQLDEIITDLAEFERRYEMSSKEFFQRYQSGQTDDRMDYVEWASLIQMADNLKHRLKILVGEGKG